MEAECAHGCSHADFNPFAWCVAADNPTRASPPKVPTREVVKESRPKAVSAVLLAIANAMKTKGGLVGL